MRKFTIDNGNCYHFTMTNTFADTLKGENRRITKIFTFTDYMYPERSGYKWLKSTFVRVYGERRGVVLYNHPKLVTKMKWGCGVTARFQNKKSGDSYYPVFRLAWNEYDPITMKNESKARYLSLTKLSPPERREGVHKLSMEAAKVRARLSMSALHKSALEFEYDLDVMPSASYVYNKDKLKVRNEF